MSPVPPLFSQRVLAMLTSAHAERGEPITDTWFRLTRRLDGDSATLLPGALALVAPLLAADRDRLRLLGDMAVAYDLFELSGPLLQLSQQLEDPEILLDVAALASHPGVPEEVNRRVRELGDVLPAELWPPFHVRLDPAGSDSSDRARALGLQRWPGIAERPPNGYTGAPLVAVAEDGMPQDVVFHLLHALRRHGAVVRRIPASFERAVDPRWLGAWTPIVAASGDVVATLRRLGLPVTAAQLVATDETAVKHRQGRRLLEAVDTVLRRHEAPRLRLPRPGEVVTLASAPIDVGVFTLGAYDAREVAYLGGGSRSSVYRWGDRVALLKPVRVEGFPYWRFNQLVAMRTYHYLRRHHRRRISLGVVEELAVFAGRDRPVDLGVTSDAIVVFEEDGAYELRSGQQVLADAVKLDATFQPFTLGEGRVPGLLEPSDHTRVHPAVLGGTPTVGVSRLSCRTIATALRHHPDEVVRRLYPRLTPAVVAEARRVGEAILG